MFNLEYEKGALSLLKQLMNNLESVYAPKCLKILNSYKVFIADE